MKHFSKTDDFTKEEYSEVCKRAGIFQEGIEKKGRDFAHLCPGKVLATMFFQESTRTSSVLQSAIIRLGGGYIGISGTAGTYLASGKEDIADFLNSFTCFSDIMAVRHKELDLSQIAKNFPIPLINAMCGKDEHSLAGLGWIYSLYRRFEKLENLKVGIYGMTKSSRPAKALIKALSLFGLTIYEDPVIEEFETPPHIKEFVTKTPTKLVGKSFGDFIKEVDFLLVVEGLPQAGEDPKLVERYNQKFKPFTQKELKLLKLKAVMMYGMPRKMTDGRDIAEEAVDKDPRVLNLVMMKEWVYMSMGLITYLLNIKV